MSHRINYAINNDLWKKIYEEQTGLCGLRLRINKTVINDLLNHMMGKYNYKCVLACEFNWFKAIESRKRGCSYWRGVFFFKNCKTKYVAEIEDEPNFLQDNTLIKIIFDDQKICTELIKSSRSSGEKRELLASKIKSKGYTKLKSENIIYNSAFPDNEGI